MTGPAHWHASDTAKTFWFFKADVAVARKEKPEKGWGHCIYVKKKTDSAKF
jgi:hypothetical protein